MLNWTTTLGAYYTFDKVKLQETCVYPFLGSVTIPLGRPRLVSYRTLW